MVDSYTFIPTLSELEDSEYKPSDSDKESEDITSNEEVFSKDISEEDEDKGADGSTTTSGKYANSFLLSNTGGKRSMIHNWKDTNSSEVKKFIAVVMMMGINHIPHMRLYWSQNALYRNEFIAKTMQRESKNVNRLSKVKPLLDVICCNFKKTLTPGESVVIDESMIPWRGRLFFRQYIPGKAHKYGVKCYKVCTPEGYTYNMNIYSGKNESTGSSCFGHTHKVVLTLTAGLLDEGRTLYIDNYYSSVILAEDLLKNKTNVCGTLRQNRRGNPQDVCMKKLIKGKYSQWKIPAVLGQALKQLSTSAPAMTQASIRTGPASSSSSSSASAAAHCASSVTVSPVESAEPVVPTPGSSKARQKKFHRHFKQVAPEERVLNYYSCALIGDILLQGHLYITKNYFAFYSNVFGYVTKYVSGLEESRGSLNIECAVTPPL
ncbi:hypothetical protein J437_LFUL016253 [Ladona fulva]|uniref:GRAM domain-containing protein n=1 Tax=Ladona fulva TaxID=123851 RepID=A0A8K0P846_LADFU|nr:hypothetical protein J437_LFUL016253 [Ladona fulva]